MKRIVSLLLTLCLLGVLSVSAASNSPALTYRTSGDNVELTLEGVAQSVTALQVTLELDGSCPDASFTPASGSFYSPDCLVETKNGKTSVTVYLVADSAVSGNGLRLGSLIPGASYRLPSSAGVKLLDRSLTPIASIGQIPLSVPSSGSDGGGSGSGSGSGSGGGSGSSSISRKIKVANCEHGSVTVKPANASTGTTVTLTAVPDSGYVLESIRVTDSRGREVELTEAGLNKRTFKMPAYEVEVHAVFAPGEDTFKMPFSDIASDAWCFDAVRYVYENGLMNGTTATTFTPNATTTRGMIVAILYRLEGSPDAGTSKFSDVNPSAYYASAVAWASENGVVNGYGDNTFKPNNPITREQMAAFLFRYATLKEQDVSPRADLSPFTDASQIAPYAVEAIQWANAQGLVNGTSATTLAPKGNATRAQVAVILSRFAQKMQA